ncbi:LANO_0C03862g1_1 [Lachancea nothofagi CBS 11611]|uniref:LANO_0C03862g1_1 n=1 Tax=Lachancea nothofagi CBS 11611 TaxID=1266666 RepID=A0A1G4J6L3_9SACH|nr:LANO_0C03862g1_1 [Lachancea nothofagi CBS 11611]
MSFPTKKLSPLDGLRNKSEIRGQNSARKSDILVLRERNDSIVSFESIKTTERLLDRLELSADDERLLQQALKEEEEARRQGYRNTREKRVVCVPASSFPSLRKASGSSNHINLNDCKPFMNIINELSEKEKIKLSQKKEVELHLPKARYSYLVEEGSDEEGNGVLEKDLCSDGRAVNFEKFRKQNLTGTSAVRPPLQKKPVSESTNKIYQHKPVMKNASYSSMEVPYESTSSIETKYLVKPNTMSSTESDVSRDSDYKNTIAEKSPKWKFSSPRKSTSASSLSQESRSPTKLSTNGNVKEHKKKSSFSFKNLFKSPKVENLKPVITDVKPTGSTAPTTPSAVKFKFPPLHLDDIGTQKFYSNAPATASSDNAPDQLKVRATQSEHTRASSDTNVYFSRKDDVTGGKNIRSDMARAKNSQQKYELTRPRTHEAARPFSQGKALTPEARVRVAIDLRNQGSLKESAEHLKVLCDLKNLTGYLLFGLALRYGSGVDRDYLESFRHLKMAAEVHSEEAELFKPDVDPFKLDKVPHVPPEPQAPALYECGISYLKGYGVNKVDEVKGLKYLEKAASLGHLDSMCLSGTIWSKSSKIRRKNKARAAAWFRLADRRGADLIGADWIYKDKYQSRSVDSL